MEDLYFSEGLQWLVENLSPEQLVYPHPEVGLKAAQYLKGKSTSILKLDSKLLTISKVNLALQLAYPIFKQDSKLLTISKINLALQLAYPYPEAGLKAAHYMKGKSNSTVSLPHPEAGLKAATI